MKKLILITSLFMILILVGPVFAANTNTGVKNTNTGSQASMSPSPTGNQVKNKNEINTQNQGEDTQLQVNTQEQENLEEGQGEGLQTRSQNAIQNMSTVAKQVQLLLQIRTTGGIGDQVRLIAKEQDQAQLQIQDQIHKLDSKSKLAKFISGTDYKAVKNLKQQLEQNQLRIQQLEQLQNQLSNQGDITMVQETIQALIQENTSLQELINSEEKVFGLLGWLFKFFAK